MRYVVNDHCDGCFARYRTLSEAIECIRDVLLEPGVRITEFATSQTSQANFARKGKLCLSF